MEFSNQRTDFSHEQGGALGADCSPAVNSNPTNLIVPVVLSGGGGSRLWPYSTKQTPKQFLPLVGDRTLYEQALDRVRDARSFTAPVVVGSMDHAEFCEAGLAAYGKEARVIL